MNKKSLLYSTLVLTSANFIVRIIGFAYRIILSRLIGAEGIGLYQLVFPVHMLTITLVTSGIPIAVSRMVSQRTALGHHQDARLIVRQAAAAVSILSIGIMFILLVSLKQIALYILHQPRTYWALIAFVPCIIILGLSSIYNGYFYGKKNVFPPALSEMVEQVLRVALVIGVLYLLAPLQSEHAAAIAMAGMVVGELSGLILVQYIYWREKPLAAVSTHIHHSWHNFKELITIAAPITGTRLISSIMHSVNSIMIPQRLVVAGYTSSQALSKFGMLTGMAMPFIFLPFTLTSALSVVMVPNLSEHHTLKEWSSIQEKISKAILITSVTAFPVVAFLMSLASPLSIFLYKEAEVGKILFLMSPLIVPFCLQHTFSGMLNGIGKQALGARNYLIGAVVLLTCTYFLVSNPRYGIYGYVIGFYFNSVITGGLNYIAVIKHGRIKADIMNWFIKPAFAAICMAISILWCYNQFSSYGLSMLFRLLFSTIIGTAVFLLLAYKMGIFSIRMFRK